jgi:predicted DNA-binding protein (MmcQ/YjbR family)
MPAARNRERIDRLSALCLALPAATRNDTGDHAAFRTRGKVFAYLLDNHHGDGILSVCCKALPGDNQRLIDANPRRFYMPAYIGPRGWVGLRLDLPTVDWSEVKELIRGSYMLAAPKKYTRTLDT